MPQKQLLELLQGYDRDVQRVLAEVLRLEQEHISMKRPRLGPRIDEVITKVAKDNSVGSARLRGNGKGR